MDFFKRLKSKSHAASIVLPAVKLKPIRDEMFSERFHSST